MAGFARRAICAVASFALLPAAGNAAEHKDISNDLTADNFSLPPAPVLSMGATNCGGETLVITPMLLRLFDLDESESLQETSGTVDAAGAKSAPAGLLRLVSLDGEAQADEGQGTGDETCLGGVVSTSAAAPTVAPLQHT